MYVWVSVVWVSWTTLMRMGLNEERERRGRRRKRERRSMGGAGGRVPACVVS